MIEKMVTGLESLPKRLGEFSGRPLKEMLEFLIILVVHFVFCILNRPCLTCIKNKCNMWNKGNLDKQIHKQAGGTKSNARLLHEKYVLCEIDIAGCNLLFIILNVNPKCYSMSRLVSDQEGKTCAS